MVESEKPLFAKVFAEEILAAVGGLILVCNEVERSLTYLVLALLREPPGKSRGAYLMLQGMDFRVKLQFVKVLAALNIPRQARAIDKLCEKLEKAFAKRHLIAHGGIHDQKGPEKLGVRSGKLKASGFPDIEFMSASDIRGHASAAWSLKNQLRDLLANHGFHSTQTRESAAPHP